MASTEDPSVLTWMIALAPRPRPDPIGKHWWRELVVGHWQDATDAWEARREAETRGYATETEAWEAENPAPRLADFMVHLSQGKIAPG